ncbi:type 4b pilus protein PilO2 [Paraburkholderia domus]|uniref:type 4b pilus protein PilO2 n=1 Tax=Paraburkholderia domus TaxID=2793075 RepID=UPI0019141D18|nr:type 4b pilus protein PilO2 [Paraburkholderia domus]MBK5064802.1 type 4b pilus protein PilO2 [Burkholderia sp. R-70199]CAE6956572.1 hypothetical protein R70199_06999 [Paraburkholderia domus]
MAHVLTLPGVKGLFAVGMSWRHEETVPRAKALRELAASMGRWGTVYTASGGGVQVGFCDPIEGLKSPGKARSLAAAVAEEFTQPWRGIFELGHGLYWYVAVRDGQEILNDGDVVGTEDDMARVWAEHDRLPEWKTEITDKPIDIIADAVRSRSKVPRLRDLSYDPAMLYIAAGAAGLLGLAIAGVGMYIHHRHQEEIMQQQSLAARAAALSAKAAADAKLAIMPWASLPLTNDVFSACQTQWAQQALSIKGWALNTWTCRADAAGITIATKWTRNGGVANDAPGRLDDGGEFSTHEIVMAQTFGGLNQDALTGEAAPRAMYTLVQTYGIKMQLVKPVDMVAKETPDVPNAVPPPPWLSYPMTMELHAPPWVEIGAAQFDHVTGLRISSIGYDSDKRVWTTMGTLYGIRDTTVALGAAVAASGAAGAVPTMIGSPGPAATPVLASAPVAVPAAPSSSVASGPVTPASTPPVAVTRPAAGQPKATDTSLTPAEPVPGPAAVAPLKSAASPAPAPATTTGNAQGGIGALALVQAHHNADQGTGAAVAGSPSTQAVRPSLSAIPPGVGN